MLTEHIGGFIMDHRRTAIFSGAVALSSFFALGAGVATGAATPHASGPTTQLLNTAQPTLHTTTTQVGAKTERVLVNAKGLPLYYYQADTAKKSQVSGVLAQLWPALVSAKPTASGVKGKVASVQQADGHQVTYNGHFLYTFVDDSPGHVTGQGVSNFFVATPNVRSIRSATTIKAAPAPVTSSRGYGY
jgi:predicted lipoprotein with Yx(FWY)xxD motif